MPKSREIHLVARPDGLPTPEGFQVVHVDVRDPGPGEVLVQNLYMSVDPAMRPRLTAGYELDQVMTGAAIGRVIASNASGLAEGDLVLSSYGFREIFVSPEAGLRRLDPVPGHPVTVHLHVMGGAGFTAYGGILHVARLRPEDRVFVSTAAGAVGSLAAQIAKIRGCWVVGSTGSAEKAEWLRDELGLDVAINYRDTPINHALREAATAGIDVYFDNVGGDHLDAALARMNTLGRVAVCGMISGYNERGARTTVHNLANIIYGRIEIRGFTAADFAHKRAEFVADMSQWLAAGQIKYRETILEGIEAAPRALIGLFEGLNTGKMLVKLAD
ncbi:MAG TPA: NADP-dependent oxidoreductase [Candidatus Dormibacteraeota bacterium]|nr:NADP-dependent oxidoreductase [Candidatus Dormibacteraeota bacterium]